MKPNIIPPPIVVLLSLVLMWLVSQSLAFGSGMASFKFLGSLLMMGGLVINALAARDFARAETTINPLTPEKSTSLVDTGVFGYSRNPIYLAMAIIVFGGFLWSGHYLNLAVVALFVWYITNFQIKPEEKALKEIFGDDYDAYCQRVRRWI